MRNDETTKMRNDETTKMRNNETTKMINDETKMRNNETTKMIIDETTKLRNDETTKMKNGGTTKMINDETKMRNNETTKMIIDETTKMRNDETTKMRNNETTKMKNSGTTKTRNNETTKMGNGELIYLVEKLQRIRPITDQALCKRGTSLVSKLQQYLQQPLLIFHLGDRQNFDHLHVATRMEQLFTIQNERNSSRHSSCKISANKAKNNRLSTCHVFTSMIATTLVKHF